jgi:hypothetical protein
MGEGPPAITSRTPTERASTSCFERLEAGDERAMSNERKRRIGENEGITRSVNELSRPLEPMWMTILCECGSKACREHVVIAQEEYARVRKDSTMFVLRPGHEDDTTEKVVSKHVEYWIVRKNPGLPANIARATDARA